MLEQFPNLKPYQFALSRAERKTGIVLDENLERAHDLSKNTYIIFDDLLDAEIEAVGLITENPEVECYIYNYRMKLVKFIDTNDLS